MAAPGRRKGKYSQVGRVLRLLDHLRAHQYAVETAALASMFGVSERQIRRDLGALDEAGHAVEQGLNPAGRSTAKLGASREALRLGIRERYTLLAVRRVFDILEGTPFQEDVRRIFDKVAASLPKEQQRDLASFGDRFVCVPDGGTKLYSDKDDILNEILTGVVYRRQVRYRYRPKNGKTSEGLLEPYAIALYKHGLYAIAHRVHSTHDATNVRVYAVERFLEAGAVKKSSFAVPAGFSIDHFFDGAFGIYVGGTPEHVVVDFDASARDLIAARAWHRTQEIGRLPGGGVRLEMDVANLTQVASWVLSWGPMARVQEPPELVARVADELRRAGDLYGSA